MKDGAGLFCAALEHLLKLQTERPKVLMATHYHGISSMARTENAEILQGGFLEETPYLQFCHMEVTLPVDAQKSNEVVFQYKYVSSALQLIVDSVLACHCPLMVRTVLPFREFHKRLSREQIIILNCRVEMKILSALFEGKAINR